MDDTTILSFAALAVAGLLSAYLIKAFSAVKMRQAQAKLAQSRHMAQVRKGGQQQAAQGAADLGKWVLDLADRFDFDEEQLYEDEMPDEISALLNHPLAKSFIGGLGQRIQGQQAEGTGENSNPNEAWF